MSDYQAFAFPSELGWMAIVGCDDVLMELTFGHSNPQRALAALQTGDYQVMTWSSDLSERLTAFAAAEAVNFDNVPVDLEYLRTPFQRQVTQQCREIPWGQTCSYGEMAAKAGSPRAARAVGNVMAANRTPLVVPCHRVVPAGTGKLGGYSAGEGVRTKLRLLEVESASILARVDVEDFAVSR